MRILAVTNLYPNPLQPFRAAFNRHQFRLLNARHPVRVVAPIAWTDERAARRRGAAPLPADRRVVTDGLTVDHPKYLFPPKVARSWYGRFYLWSVGPTVRQAAAEFRPDVLFAPWAYPDGWAAVRLGRRLGVPVVVQVHGSDIKLLDQFPARRRRTAEAVAQADGVVAVSRDLANDLERLGVNPAAIRVIHDGVDRGQFCPAPQAAARERLGLPATDRIVLFVGNLVPVKGVDVAIRAIAELTRAGEDLRFIVVGDGPLRAELQSLAQALGVADRVTFQGPVPHADLPAWYQAADVFVLPSHSEGVPNVILEAAACGRPWVATRVGGLPEVAHLGDGGLVPPNDPSALAAAIRSKLTGPPSADAPRPRERAEAVAELAEFLDAVVRSRRG